MTDFYLDFGLRVGLALVFWVPLLLTASWALKRHIHSKVPPGNHRGLGASQKEGLS